MSNRLFFRTAAIAFLFAASSLSVLPQDQGLLTQKAISADMALTMFAVPWRNAAPITIASAFMCSTWMARLRPQLEMMGAVRSITR